MHPGSRAPLLMAMAVRGHRSWSALALLPFYLPAASFLSGCLLCGQFLELMGKYCQGVSTFYVAAVAPGQPGRPFEHLQHSNEKEKQEARVRYWRQPTPVRCSRSLFVALS